MNRCLRSAVLISCLLLLIVTSAQCQNDRRAAARQRAIAGAQSGVQSDVPVVEQCLGATLSDLPKARGVQGVLVSEVAVGSSMDEAGIMVGDLITQFAGQEIKAGADLTKAVSGLTSGHRYLAIINRGKQSLQVLVTVRETTADAAASTVKRSLSDINVLKYAVIDPKTRSVTLIGKYDPTYPTGPIPYYDLLNDALTSPYPSFSLEPTKQTRDNVEKVHQAIAGDVEKMATDVNYTNTFANRLMTVILYDPSCKRDKAQFVKKGAEAFQLTEDEMLKVLTDSANGVSSDDMIPITGKMLVGLGYGQVGEALMGQQGDSAGTFEKLGITTEANDIITKFHSGDISKDQATIQLGVLMEVAILRGLRVPENDIQSRADQVLNGRMGLDEFQKYMEDCLMAIVVDQVGLKMFNGLTLSHDVLCKLYNISTPQMDLVFKDVPPESVLGDILYRADYTLKSICTNPEIKQKVPGFLTEQEYLYNESRKAGTRIPADVGVEAGHRLVPGAAEMRVSASGDLVSFGNTQVNILGWLTSEPTGKRATKDVVDFLSTAVDGYADYLTQNYDQLAKAYPQLHRIREAAKLIALSRWAKTNNYSITVDKSNGLKLAPPATTNGFWNAVFTADKEEFSLTVITEGGATFDKDEGEAWIKPTVDVELTADVNKQLAYSTVFAKQAAMAAIDGDMESARDLADKSARAMTGEIDFTQLPKLDVPIPTEPAAAAALSSEGMAAIDENMRQIENAQISIEKAGELQATSPDDAAELRASAEQQKQSAEAKLKDLRDALDEAMQDSTKTQQALVTIRNNSGSATVTPMVATAPSGTASANSNAGTSVAASTNDDARDKAIAALQAEPTEEQKQKWLAELESLRKELEGTKAQFAKLNKSIQQDQQQFTDWEKVASDGMDKCSGFLYNLLMDAGAGGLSERYETMHELAKKLPNKPADLIDKLGKTKDLLTGLSRAQTAKDVSDLASREAQTVPELLEAVRDGITQILAVTALDKTPAGALWKYGSGVVDMSYSFAEFCAAYDGIEQMDKNSDSYLKAVAALSQRMSKLVTRINDIKGQLEASGVAVPASPHGSGR